MKKLLQVLFLLPAIASAQSQNQNYIAATAYKVPTVNGTSIIGGGTVTPDNKQTVITYFDGLGRPIQKIAHRYAHSGGDVVTHIEYDAFGRQVKNFLPYVRTSGSMNYDAGALTSVINFYASPNFTQHGDPNFEATNTPFSEKKLENSPLERLFKRSSAGNDWAMPVSLSDPDRTIRYEYHTAQQGEIRRYSAVSTWNASNGSYDIAILNPQMSMMYAAGQLYKTIVKDENWTSGQLNTVEEYSNKTGQVVLKKSFNLVNGIVEAHDTYYVYDQYDNLTFVVPPLAYGNIGTDLDGLCFQYKYDARNRLVEKKVPGKQWEYIVYNKFDQVVAIGPANSPFNEPDKIGWLITKYDGFSRPVITGWIRENAITSVERKTLQNIMDAQTTNLYENKLKTGQNSVDGIPFHYTNLAWPAGSTYNILTVNYYDDYNFLQAPATFSVMIDGAEQAYYNNTSHKPKGLATATWIRTLTTSNSTKGEHSYFLYDKKARTVRVYTENYLTGFTCTDSKLDFEGKLVSRITYHDRDPAGIQELTTREDFTYSTQGRLLTHIHQVTPPGQTMPQEQLSWNDYTELGQLKSKRVGGGPSSTPQGLQKIDYSYNIRGWLTTINSVDNLAEPGEPTDLFGLKLNYNAVEVPSAVGTALYNGNISEAYWMTHPENIMRKYSYEYDGLNRLTEAVYQKPRLNNPTTNAYNESVKYDKNGNILHLTRSGYQDNDSGYTYEIDDLEYHYKSNKLTTVIDHSNSWDGFKDGQNPNSSQTEDYKYDGNGNMTQDWNKGISNIAYNHLNLPTKIEFGTNGQRKIQYIYNALGNKVKRTVVDPSNSTDPSLETDYLGGFQYQKALLQFFPTAEGYVNVTEGIKFNYVYTHKDQLGNVRLSYSKPKGGDITILEENHYYPFGMRHINYGEEKNKYVFNPDQSPLYAVLEATERSDFQYKFNGQEYQDELDLKMTAMEYRQYDNVLGRFNSIDALSDMQYSTTPYHFSYNNPVYWSDPTGLFPTDNPWLETMWNITAPGTDSFWYNNGTGMTSDNLGAGFGGNVDFASGQFAGFQSLNEITISRANYYSVGNGAGLLERARYQAYSGSKYYQHVRDKWSSDRWDEFQNTLDWMGTAPLLGEPIDLINGGISAIRGNYGSAGLSVAAAVPFAGWLATAVKIQKHHIIPKAVFKEFKDDLSGLMKRDGIKNLLALPVPYHLGGHKAYNEYVTKELNYLKENGMISKGSIEALQGQLKSIIGAGIENFNKTGENLNTYFKNL